MSNAFGVFFHIFAVFLQIEIFLKRCMILPTDFFLSDLQIFFPSIIIRSMKAIITVVGGDRVGIIARVSAFLSEHSINIDDITQTILSGNFVMMMMVDLSKSDLSIDNTRKALTEEGKAMGVEVNMMAEKVFTEMHRI